MTKIWVICHKLAIYEGIILQKWLYGHTTGAVHLSFDPETWKPRALCPKTDCYVEQAVAAVEAAQFYQASNKIKIIAFLIQLWAVNYWTAHLLFVCNCLKGRNTSFNAKISTCPCQVLQTDTMLPSYTSLLPPPPLLNTHQQSHL